MIVQNAFLGIPGLGELTIYDVALRIGVRLGLTPNYVYLHAGTKAGARRLGVTGFRLPGCMVKVALPNDFPAEIQDLICHELEEFLCIYCRYF